MPFMNVSMYSCIYLFGSGQDLPQITFLRSALASPTPNIWRVPVGFKVKSVGTLLVTVSNYTVTSVEGSYTIDIKLASTNCFFDYSARLALEFSS